MMLMFPTQNLFIEGPDCSGKTTLVKNIHEFTGYKWHIHDRSQISRKIFCEMYSRTLDNLEDDFHNEIFNLNNRFICLLPDFEVIKKIKVRGRVRRMMVSLKKQQKLLCCTNLRKNIMKEYIKAYMEKYLTRSWARMNIAGANQFLLGDLFTPTIVVYHLFKFQ